MSEENIEIGWSDFLGNPIKKDVRWLPFEEARDFARSLDLKSQTDWREYCSTGNKPHNIPSNVNQVYKDKGWQGFGDFLGTGNKSAYEWLPFEEARAFARSLNLKSQGEWRSYHKENKPEGIPSAPNRTYKDKGWKGIGDWLGSGTIASKDIVFLSFEEARDFARSLNLKTQKDWAIYSRSGDKPYNIPAKPDNTYKESGWGGYGDWLGTGTIASRDMEFIPFEEAREFARSLNLKSSIEWFEYHKENKPEGTPSAPNRTYKDKGWKNWGDFLGTGNAPRGGWLSFEEARAFARGLNLKSRYAWLSYHKDNRPEGIPARSDKLYKDKGWISWKDFLGN